MNRCFLFYNTALWVLCRRLCTLRYNIDALNDGTVIANHYLEHLTGFALVTSGKNNNHIVFSNM